MLEDGLDDTVKECRQGYPSLRRTRHKNAAQQCGCHDAAGLVCLNKCKSETVRVSLCRFTRAGFLGKGHLTLWFIGFYRGIAGLSLGKEAARLMARGIGAPANLMDDAGSLTLLLRLELTAAVPP